MTATQTLKTGTRIEVIGFDFATGKEVPQPAKIARWTAACGPIKNHVSPTNGGWHVVRFADDGGSLLCHETRFRVIDNRAA